MTNSFCTACGVSTEVGSSRIKSFGLGQQRAHDLDPLAFADRERVHRPQRIDVEPVAPATSRMRAVTSASESDLSRPSQTFSAAVSVSNRREVLVDHADAERARLGGRRDLDALAVPAHLALVGPHGAVDDLHQRRLAGAVLAQHGVDLARRDAQARPGRWPSRRGTAC